MSAAARLQHLQDRALTHEREHTSAVTLLRQQISKLEAALAPPPPSTSAPAPAPAPAPTQAQSHFYPQQRVTAWSVAPSQPLAAAAAAAPAPPPPRSVERARGEQHLQHMHQIYSDFSSKVAHRLEAIWRHKVHEADD